MAAPNCVGLRRHFHACGQAWKVARLGARCCECVQVSQIPAGMSLHLRVLVLDRMPLLLPPLMTGVLLQEQEVLQVSCNLVDFKSVA